MGTKSDPIEPLVDDILYDVAESFFEKRRLLEAKIDLFHEFVSDLKRMAAGIQFRAALLNLLLVDDRQADAFYRMLGIEGEAFLAAKLTDPRSSLSHIPFGFSFVNRHTKIVCEVYTILREDIHHYLNGRPQPQKKAEHLKMDPVYYRLIVKMHQVLNREIDRINASVSPSSTLQFAKEFKPDVLVKEKVTGGGITDATALDDKLCYRPIDFSSLGLPAFPPLPSLDDVRPSIKSFCQKLCRRYPKELKNIIDFIKQRINAP